MKILIIFHGVSAGSKPMFRDDEDEDVTTLEVDYYQLEEEDIERNKRHAIYSNQNRSSFSKASFQDRSSCGTRSVTFEPPRNGRIVNGVDAPSGAYPWQVSYLMIKTRAQLQYFNAHLTPGCHQTERRPVFETVVWRIHPDRSLGSDSCPLHRSFA